MKRKYSLAYLTIPGTDPVNQIRIARETGYDYVSLRTIPLHLPNEPEFYPDRDQELFRSIQKALRDYDMPLMDIELARVFDVTEFEVFKPAFDAAARLGATDVLGSVWTRNRARYTENAGRVADLAASFGLNYNIEFLPWAGVRNLQEAITLIDDIGRDNAFIMVDTLHAGRAGVTADELKRTPARYFNFMHLCDGPAGPDGDPVLDNIRDDLMLETARENRLYPGDGCMDIYGMVNALPVMPLSIELPNLKNMEELGAKEHAARCLKKARALLDE
ncbi:MAG: sugar phosphate isomerase/epimerase [Lachnospiraceae bacterium]|nr:sugar phosphate isomerase/epimerase [Lachnospiraceae bacterium]